MLNEFLTPAAFQGMAAGLSMDRFCQVKPLLDQKQNNKDNFLGFKKFKSVCRMNILDISVVIFKLASHPWLFKKYLLETL